MTPVHPPYSTADAAERYAGMADFLAFSGDVSAASTVIERLRMVADETRDPLTIMPDIGPLAAGVVDRAFSEWPEQSTQRQNIARLGFDLSRGGDGIAWPSAAAIG